MLQTTYSDMYIIKVKGKAKIPDYIQLRDEKFVLIAYFRADRPLQKLEKFGLEGKEEELKKVIDSLPFGKLQKLEL
tara:strand:+ start:515 stop:742 length:228 start_codon:yes stop_codon:yes gene_type:complete